MRIGSLFSGIGGLELGLERSGLGDTVWQVEQSEYCRGVLARHWPNAERFEDVGTVGAEELSEVDIICGGFPCQDISSAGKGAGLAGSRSGLWHQFARIIGDLQPRWVVVENVASGAVRWVDSVTTALELLGYQTLSVPLSAQDVGAPHLRRRIFIIAHAKREQLRQQPRRRRRQDGQSALLTPEHGQEGAPASSWAHWNMRPTVSPVCRVDDGVPDRSQRLEALGNAVVPQCAEVVGWMIREMEEAMGETR